MGRYVNHVSRQRLSLWRCVDAYMMEAHASGRKHACKEEDGNFFWRERGKGGGRDWVRACEWNATVCDFSV
jgi:hypothetical protein